MKGLLGIGRLSMTLAVALAALLLGSFITGNGQGAILLGQAHAQEATLIPDFEGDLQPLITCDGSLQANEQITGSIDFPGAECVYTFEGRAAQTVVVTMDRVDGDLMPEIALLAPDGTEVATSELLENSDGSGGQLRFDLQDTGTYQVVARSVNGETSGTFTLELSAYYVTYIAPTCGGRIAFGQTLSDTILGTGSSASCSYTFTGNAGDLVTIRMTSLELDTFVELYAPNKSPLLSSAPYSAEESNDDAEGTTDSLIRNHGLLESGVYTIVAKAYSEGKYQLTLSRGGYQNGERVRVVYHTTLPLRRTAGYVGKPANDIVAQVPRTSALTILGGPVQKDFLVWYRVRYGNNVSGWAPEIDVKGRRVFASQ